jgi:ADP-ribosylglycohydrolase
MALLGGVNTSTRSGSAQSVYGQSSATSGSAMKITTALVVIVLVELGILVWLRHAFRHHNGG